MIENTIRAAGAVPASLFETIAKRWRQYRAEQRAQKEKNKVHEIFCRFAIDEDNRGQFWLTCNGTAFMTITDDMTISEVKKLLHDTRGMAALRETGNCYEIETNKPTQHHDNEQ